MSVFNVVRFRVKPEQDARFLDAHREGRANWPGLERGTMIKTGDRTYCLIGEWRDADAIAAARARMIETLNSFRDTLEDLGSGLGVTDAVSGPVVLDLTH
jgi:quinol monooxygenase YgiN